MTCLIYYVTAISFSAMTCIVISAEWFGTPIDQLFSGPSLKPQRKLSPQGNLVLATSPQD